ncbi:MAG TPA: Dabb family protein [Streptosporangiaceae bacterium]|nr:Dabb family protein [Streptosporangiaceae bacterium]
MIRHVVLLTWKPDATPEQLQQVVTDLSTLPTLVPGIRDYRFGTDAGLAAGNADFAITADFDDADAYLAYSTHPAHLDVISRTIRPILEQRVAVQYAI